MIDLHISNYLSEMEERLEAQCRDRSHETPILFGLILAGVAVLAPLIAVASLFVAPPFGW